MSRIVPSNTVTTPPNAEKVFSGMIYDVYQWQQKMFDGSYHTFEMLKRPDTLKVIAVKDGKIVLTEQEQPGLPPFIDVPGGRHDKEGETELAAAQREMLEETGMTFRSWKLINIHQPFIKIDWLVYTFLATDFINQVPQELDAGEKIKVALVDFDEVKRKAKDPKARFLPKEFDDCDSIEKLLGMPEFKVS